MKRINAILTALTLAGFTAAANAGSIAYETQYSTNGHYERSARIVVSPRLHPEVEVSRTLAAQPVHPHMVKVIIGGDISPYSAGAVQHTWIDPMNRLDGENGLDESHSLVKAQRAYLSLSGISQRQLDEHRIRSKQLESTYAGQTRARIIINARPDATSDPSLKPVLIVPRPATAPMPSVPAKPQPKADEQSKTIAEAPADPTDTATN
jgi:hypothetical protein